ncbi:olfactory receptor 52M1-like [Tachyglossus aculeatus]|uniref:olfactory receptor 52M1-like n=1 Tax=Tachyglossus aculeatus TaxID=9261 RepID=UPI0018F77A45|nr:olfactory receptor 52M1-like [Tachyglossus aculeatus]
MPASQNTCFTPSSFLLTGILGLEAQHIWMGIPFCSLFVAAVLGNTTILWVVRAERSLHQPMFLFLAMLAVTDLVLSTSTVPRMLAVFWLSSREIGLDACLAQMFLVHCFATVESGIFVAMAFDRYVAICTPLRHSAVLPAAVVARMGLAALLRGALYISPLPLLLRWQLPSYWHRVIAHSYCEHIAVVALACGDRRPNDLYGMAIGFLVLILDSLAIAASYARIFSAVRGLAAPEARRKTAGTCTTHICTVLAFYVPIVLSSLTHRFGHNVPPPVHILLANVYLLVPPVLNPIVYAVRTRHLRETLLRRLC